MLTGETMRISTSWITVDYGEMREIHFFHLMEYLAKNSKNSLRFSRWTLDNECIVAQLTIWNFNDTGHPVVRWMRDGLFSELYSNFWYISVFLCVSRAIRTRFFRLGIGELFVELDVF